MKYSELSIDVRKAVDGDLAEGETVTWCWQYGSREFRRDQIGCMIPVVLVCAIIAARTQYVHDLKDLPAALATGLIILIVAACFLGYLRRRGRQSANIITSRRAIVVLHPSLMSRHARPQIASFYPIELPRRRVISSLGGKGNIIFWERPHYDDSILTISFERIPEVKRVDALLDELVRAKQGDRDQGEVVPDEVRYRSFGLPAEGWSTK